MNNLQLEERLTVPEPVAPAAEEAFTARELDVAEQLIHLSASSASSGTSRAGRRAPAGSGGSSSPHSVNAPAPVAAPLFLGGCAGWEEDEEQEVAGSQRRVKRYRLIAKIYAATEEIGGRGGSSRKNKKNRWIMDREEKDPVVINVVDRG
jgi:hypothetical protein